MRLSLIIVASIFIATSNLFGNYSSAHVDICEVNEYATVVPVEIPECLSQSPRKDWLFSQDPFFRESYAIFSEEIDDLENFFREHTYMIIKPDGLVNHSFDRVVRALYEDGYEIVSYDTFEYDLHACKLFWFYQANFFPNSWFPLFEMVLADKKSVIFLLRDATECANASQRLLELKGSTLDRKRDARHIRRRIGAGSGLFCFIHSPDDSLSMIREWGVVLSRDQIRSLLKHGRHQGDRLASPDFMRFRNDVYQNYAWHDLDYDKTKMRLCQLAENLESGLREQMLQYVTCDEIPWQDFVAFIEEHNLQIPQWDLTTFCGNRSEDIQLIQPLIE